MMRRVVVFYPVASGSNIDSEDDEYFPFEEELINDLETGTTATEETPMYTQSINDIQSLMIFMIFFMGIGAGLVFGKIMWGRLK